MANLDVRQNGQMPRLCAVREPGVDVLYVAPFPLNDDIAHYYQKVLEIGGIEDPHKRFKVIVPENYHRFPPHFSLTSLLLYSPRALRRIANFCRGRNAYIVPNVVGPEELRLSMALSLPLLAPEPATAALFGSKSGSKRIFQAAQVNIPPGAHDLYDEQQLLVALARLIATHLDVPRWVIKMDDESGGRGTAHVETASLLCHKLLLREHDAAPSRWEEAETQARVQQTILDELQALLPGKAVINAPWLWPTWRDFVTGFKQSGGVIEASPLELAASPSANLFIEPDGTLSLSSTHEQIFSSRYTCVGAAFPQTAVPFPALREASLAIGRACYERGVIGHIGVDFAAFIDTGGLLRVWAVDLNLRLTCTAVSFGFFNFFVGGSFDGETGMYYAPESSARSVAGGSGAPRSDEEERAALDKRQRFYVMNDLMYHPQLPSVHHSAFFNMCRLKGVSFDLEEKVGTVFNLMDSFAGGVLGILTTGRSLIDALRKYADTLDFIQKQVGPATAKLTQEVRETTFSDVIKSVKALVDKQVSPSGDAPSETLLRRAAGPDSRYLPKGR